MARRRRKNPKMKTSTWLLLGLAGAGLYYWWTQTGPGTGITSVNSANSGLGV